MWRPSPEYLSLSPRMLTFSNNVEPANGFLVRYLRRKLLESDTDINANKEELLRVLDWVPKLWYHLHTFLEKHSTSDFLIGTALLCTSLLYLGLLGVPRNGGKTLPKEPGELMCCPVSPSPTQPKAGGQCVQMLLLPGWHLFPCPMGAVTMVSAKAACLMGILRWAQKSHVFSGRSSFASP